MRRVLALLPVIAVGVACAQPVNSADIDPKGGTTSKDSAGCSISREQILGSVSAARSAAIQRGFDWLDQDVPYSQSATFGGYRTDCSGFVSMCWELGEPGETTSSIPGVAIALGSYDELVPGDAIDDPGHHVVMFLGWDDDAHSGACVIEQASTASDMQFRVRSTDSLQSGGFQPFRAPQFDGDTQVGTGTTVPTTPTFPTTPTIPGIGTGTTGCTPDALATTCFNARDLRGVQCGATTNNCGQTVDCTTVPGFSCSVGSCVANKCGGGTCIKKAAAQACIDAKEQTGAECGQVSDGCGGKVSCDGQPEYGCETGKKCNSQNKCAVGGGEIESGDGVQRPTPLVAGEPGDVNGPAGDTAKNKTGKNSKNWQLNSVKQSEGCSAAPGSTGSTDNGGLALAGVALALVTTRRRRRA